MNQHMRSLQAALKGLGADPGPVDGEWGPRTEAALQALISARGKLPAGSAPVLADAVTDLPWMAEAKRMLGRHEVRDSRFLARWMKLDGKTLGDPAKLPWCGDFVETSIRLALPGETFTGPLAANPYWARNWLGFGEYIAPTYGAVAVFSRGQGGHVGFVVGEDGEALHVLGGNQSNTVSITRMPKSRLLGTRWPGSFPRPLALRLPRMGRDGQLSQNEA